MNNLAETLATTITLSEIRRDGGTQMRENISDVTVITYAEHMLDGAEFPAITVFYDGAEYWLADGFHRCAAYEKAGYTEVPADIRSGTQKDAVRFALKANATNGRPRTEGDMRRAYHVAVEMGLCTDTDTDALAELISCTIRHARRLTEVAREKEKAARDAEIIRLKEDGLSNYKIADEVGVSESLVRKVSAHKGTMSERAHNIEAPDPIIQKLEKEYEEAERKERLAIENKIKEEKRLEKQSKIEERRAYIEQQAEDIRTGKVIPPKGEFDVIAIDPPWNYGREYDPESSRVANPYPEMSQDELLAIDLPAKDDSVLFLWTTHQFIFDAKELLDHWGYTYKATMVWDKERIGMGAWLRMQCEFCLVGVRGKPFWDNTTYRDIIREPRREHSRKPDSFFAMVEKITAGRRLEYFSREQREGWEVFGNEIEKF